MHTGDIETHIQDIFGIEASDTTIGRVTDKILPVVQEWRWGPLEIIYAASLKSETALKNQVLSQNDLNKS